MKKKNTVKFLLKIMSITEFSSFHNYLYKNVFFGKKKQEPNKKYTNMTFLRLELHWVFFPTH